MVASIEKVSSIVDKKITCSEDLPSNSISLDLKSEPISNDFLSKSNSLLESLPHFLHSLIDSAFDVRADGNCGFRAVAVTTGRKEDDWLIVKRELRAEAVKNEMLFRNIWGDKDYDRFLDVLNFEKSPAPRDKWMCMSDFGCLIANTYRRPVHFFSPSESVTSLPYTHGICDHPSISIGFIYSCHFIPLRILGNAAVPPVVPCWEKWAKKDALLWKDILAEKVKKFQKLLPVHANSSEIAYDLTSISSITETEIYKNITNY